jgi:2-dehydropantoate 2-reductase
MPIQTATVIGAGAMGGIFGAQLARSGIETTFLDVSTPLVDHLRSEGLALVRADGEDAVPVKATTDPAEVPPADLVAVFVKCFQTEDAVRRAAPAIGPETTVLSLQNGWGNGDTISRLVEPERVVLGVTYVSGTVLDRGRIGWTGSGPTYVGDYSDGGADRATPVAEALERAGFAVSVAGNVREEIWKKLTLNAATLPTAALTGLTAGALAGTEAMSALVDDVAREAIAVARAAGYDLDEAATLDRIHTVLAGAGDGKASMLQDVEAGRRTEIDVITGAVLRAGAEHGVPTPANRTLYALISGFENARGLA